MSLNPLRGTLEDVFVEQVARRVASVSARRSRRESIAIIAGGVFRDSIRDRIGYGLVFFSILLMASSFLLAQLTAGQDVKIIKDLGLASASMIGLFIAIFFGIGLVTKEVERRSIYSLLSKPVTRSQFVIGKYLGLVLTLLINLS